MVSVIIPSYNHAPYLKQRIDSVLDQSFQDFELIILDDASTDKSREVIEPYRGHKKISHIIYNTENSGSPFKQWKKGIELAQGDYIWIAESDDWADLSFLEILLESFGSANKPALTYCQSFMVDAVGMIIRDNIHWTDSFNENRWNYPYRNSGLDELKKYLIHKNIIPNASAVIFRKDLARGAIKGIERFKYLGDWFFWIKMLGKGDIQYIPNRLNYFRSHSNSTRIHDTPEKIKIRYCEQYDLISLAKNKVNLSGKELNEIYNSLFYRWIMVTGVNWISSHWYRSLFAHAQRIDKQTFIRFLRYFAGTFKNKLFWKRKKK